MKYALNNDKLKDELAFKVQFMEPITGTVFVPNLSMTVVQLGNIQEDHQFTNNDESIKDWAYFLKWTNNS